MQPGRGTDCNVVAHLNTRKLFSPWGFPNLLFPLLRSFSFPSSLFFCPTLFSLCLLGQQEWGLQNCCAKLEVAEPGVREKYKLSSHAKWTHQELSPAVVLSWLLSSRQNYLQSDADNTFTCIAMQNILGATLCRKSSGTCLFYARKVCEIYRKSRHKTQGSLFQEGRNEIVSDLVWSCLPTCNTFDSNITKPYKNTLQPSVIFFLLAFVAAFFKWVIVLPYCQKTKNTPSM